MAQIIEWNKNYRDNRINCEFSVRGRRAKNGSIDGVKIDAINHEQHCEK